MKSRLLKALTSSPRPGLAGDGPASGTALSQRPPKMNAVIP